MPRTRTGRVYKRGNRWWIQYGHRGKTFRESAKSTKRKDAIDLLKKRMAEMGMGKLVGPSADRVTFEDLSRMIADDYQVQGRRATKQLASTLKRLGRNFAGSLALDITTDRITAYVRERLAQGYQPGTVRRDVAALKRAFNLAIQAGHLATKPYIPNVHVKDVREGFLTMAEVEAVCREIGPDLAPVVRFATLTGWRKREVLGLKWPQVDFEAGTVHLEAARSKNEEGRTFPFRELPQLEQLLRDQHARTRAIERETGQIVPHVFHRGGAPIRSMRHAWNAAVKRADLAGAWFHDLRRTAVMHLERAGVPRSVATKLTGHKTEAVYRRYAIADAAALAEGVEKLARLHAGKSAQPAVMPMQR